MDGRLLRLEFLSLTEMFSAANFQQTVLGRYLELSERSRHRTVATVAVLSIAGVVLTPRRLGDSGNVPEIFLCSQKYFFPGLGRICKQFQKAGHMRRAGIY